ncbi:hypothetical protein D3C71_1344960 [compost metagenome]
MGGQLDDFAARLVQALAHRVAPGGVGDHVEATHRKRGAHAQHHVGVIAGPALCIGRRKHHRLVVEVGAKALQRHRVGAVRQCGVGDAPDVVQHHRARAFQIHAVGLQAGVVDHVLHAVFGLEQLDHIAAPLAAAVVSHHGVDRHMPARMGREPVVGEYGIGGIAVSQVVEQVHAHACGFQLRSGSGDFGMRAARSLGCVLSGREGLKGVVGRSFGVGVKAVGAHHHDGAGGLGTGLHGVER